MRTNILFLLVCIFITSILNAQIVPPPLISYSGVAKNGTVPINQQTIGLELSITDGSNTLYSETFTPITNVDGSFTVEIGNGSFQLGSFANIDWKSGEKYLYVGMDITGSNNYVAMGSTRFLSVPYAFVAKNIMLPYHDATAQAVPAFEIVHEGTSGQPAIKGVFTGTVAGGVGVQGTSNSANGYGISGITTGEHGVGVYANGNGALNTALFAVSSETGSSGIFNGGMVRIENNPNVSYGGNLTLKRTGGIAPVSIQMSTINANDHYWRLNATNTPGVEAFTFTNTGTQLFRIGGDGSISFSGSSGTQGQVLTSTGAGSPQWVTPISYYNNTHLYDQWSNATLTTTEAHVASGQLSGNTFTIPGTSSVIIHFSHSKIINGASGGGNSKVRFVIELVNTANNAVVNWADLFEIIPNNEIGNVAYTHHCTLNGWGTYKVNIKAQIISGDTDITLQGISGNNSAGQLSIQVIPQ